MRLGGGRVSTSTLRLLRRGCPAATLEIWSCKTFPGAWKEAGAQLHRALGSRRLLWGGWVRTGALLSVVIS